VAVIAPTAGEKIFTGSVVPLRWQSSDNRRVVRHRVALYRSTATTPQLITNIADLGGESLSFNWLVPNNAATNVGRLRVVAVDDEGAETEAFSTSDFAIESRWQSQAALPGSLNRLAAASDSKFVYQIGGRTSTANAASITNVQRLDPAAATPAWEALAPLPSPVNSGKAVTVNGKIYMPGGITQVAEADRSHYVYDIAGNSWAKMAEPPIGVHAYSVAADPANNRYFMTGGSDVVVSGLNNAQVYNIQNNTWTPLPAMNQARFAHESAFVGGKLYVIGGRGPSGMLLSGEVFDFTTQRWTPIADAPRQRWYGNSALAQDSTGKIYWLIIGGEDTSSVPFNNVDIYDFAANRWLSLDGSYNLPTNRARQGSATLGGFVYTFGGNSTSATTVTINERFSVNGLTIISPNQPPLMVVPATQQIALPGRELSFVVSAQDLGSSVPVTITPSGMPNGATFNSTNDTNNSARGTFRWTPTAADVGRNISVSFTAADGSLTDVKVVQITVVQTAPVAAVNAADFRNAPLAADSIAAAFGTNLAPRIEIAQSFPLPTSLAETMLTVNGIPAPLFFVSPTQINFVVPAGVESGSATIIVSNGVSNGLGNYSLGNIQIVAAAPAIFTANASGTGDAAAQTTIDGINFLQPPFDVLVNGRPNILVMYGTGFRRAPAANPNDGNGVAESVTATIDGRTANVQYAGAQGGFAGLDQLNIEMPASLAGTGPRRIEVVINVNGVAANRVTIQIK
jgi:uncharacterized protein (TIGR03437 family)